MSQDFITDHLNMKSDTQFLHDIWFHFELDHILHNFFELCSSLFGIKRIEELKKDNNIVWDQDVKLFHIYDDSKNRGINSGGRKDSTGMKKLKIPLLNLNPYCCGHKSS